MSKLPTSFATLASFLTNTLLSPTKSYHCLNLAILTLVHVAASGDGAVIDNSNVGSKLEARLL